MEVVGPVCRARLALFIAAACCAWPACFSHASRAQAGEPALRVGLGSADITPAMGSDARPVWLAGYGQNRKASRVHDPLMARAVVLEAAGQKVALVSVDLLGLQYPAVQEMRRQLGATVKYLMVSSTHNHEGPDTVGIWGPNPITCGVDPAYIRLVIDRVVQLVKDTAGQTVPATAEYGTAADESLLGDSRLPRVYDDVLRVLKFRAADNSQKLLGALVQWNCHPEAMGRRNTELTADFVYYTVKDLETKLAAPVAYFSGAVGGLMAPPDGKFLDESGAVLLEGDFRYTEAYGLAVAKLAEQALANTRPIRLTDEAGFVVSAKPVTVPLINPLYRLAKTLGVLRRAGRVWTGDFEQLGELREQEVKDEPSAVETEVAYLRLGELHVACIPGELYPELVYGKFQEPAEPGVDYPNAPLEEPIAKILPGEKMLIFGLANDEIGYLIPKRQWDQLPPYAYGRARSQYGEVNSVGPDAAPIVMQALRNRVNEVTAKGAD